MLNVRFGLWFLFLLLVSSAHAQQNPMRNARVFSGDTIKLDSLSIVPGSFVLRSKGAIVDPSAYHLDLFRSEVFIPKSLKGTFNASFRVFSVAFTTPLRHKNPDLLRPNFESADPFKYSARSQPNSIFGSSSLEKRGSISRGVSFGNNQNLSVNSNLNLQLSGRISDNIRILASISDENIPIQPEGNTQQLQDFDQVFIQLYDDNNKLIAGDFQQKQASQSYFAKYLKRAQGAFFSSKIKTDKNLVDSLSPSHTIQTSAAVSRGKFSRNVVQGVEGNQGPYRLRGENGESFIVILSGTERVYIDGRLLKRGQEYDYVINYNTAELIFTANQFITKDKRIVVEFQYSDRNYARSILQISDEYKSQKTKAFINLYSEQDSKNQSLQQDLTDEQKSILRSVGDSLDLAIAPSINAVEFDQDLILYKLVDTLGYDSIFVYSSNPDSDFYQLVFSQVGENQGNYRLARSLANGKVYEWVAPLGGLPQGNFEPIQKLITPKVRRMLSAGLEQKLGAQSLFKIEGALSENDLNTFSNLDSQDDYGFAGKMELSKSMPVFGKKDTVLGPWNLELAGGLEYWQENFQEIERIRSVEFYRDWNLRGVSLGSSQLLSNFRMRLFKKKRGYLNYELQNFGATAEFQGLRNSLDAKYLDEDWDLSLLGSLLQTDGSISSSDFQRHKSLLKRRLGKVYFGYRDDFEWNRRRDPGKGSLSSTSYQFWEREVFLESPNKQKNKFKLSYIQRRDKAVQENELRTATYAQALALEMDLLKNRNHRFKTRNSYRQLEVYRSDITSQAPDNSLNSRFEYNMNALNGFIRSNTFVEVSSGLEARKEFSYIEVPTGQGVYAWIDYNDNGQQELDEFEIAQFTDQATFIKIFTPSDDYVKIFTNQFNQSLFLSPASLFGNKKKSAKDDDDELKKKKEISQKALERRKKAQKFAGRFQNQLAYRIERKTAELPILERFNPLPIEIADSSLISMSSNFRNTLYFNRSNPKFGADIGYQDIRGRNLLVNGFDARENSFYLLTLRFNLSKQWMLTSKYSEGIKRNESEVFSSRNYRFQFEEYEPKLSFQPSTSLRASILFNYREKSNAADFGGELAVVRKTGFEFKYNFIGTGSLLANLNYVLITYNGSGNDALSFEMLEGLQSGSNITWSALFQRTLANNLQLNLQYNGRKTETGPYIHAGGVQLRAFF